MKRRANRARQKQINILHTTTRQRHSRKQFTMAGVWIAIVVAMIVGVGVTLHVAAAIVLNHALYTNPRYVLKKIEIQPDHLSQYAIQQAAALEPGQQNLWTLNLPKIAHDIEKLPYVSSAKVERHFPDRLLIRITERVPVVKIVGINDDLGTRETFYLDRECIVLKPRADEPPRNLPEVIGLTNAEGLEPGVRLEQPILAHALEILDALGHISELNTSIDNIRSIDLSQPLSIKMVTTRDMSITFRPDCIPQQLMRLTAIFERYNNDQRTIHTVDLTPDQNVPVTFYE